METKLDVRNLTISFRTQNGKVQAVRDVSFELYKGETLAIVGESGSGKSVTNRAIMGILANNAIVESGEIVYDGKDLLKIPEEEMVKLRGDKVAMIFQDPMSSLNPIMRIGKQLTEAMLLKAKASMRNARTLFNNQLKLLNKNLDEALGAEEQAKNKEICQLFDKFCIKSAALESAYNKIHRTALELKLDIENVLFLVSKKQQIDERKVLKKVITQMPLTVHPDIVVMTDELKADIAELESGLKSLGLFGRVDELPGRSLEIFKKFVDILENATNRPKPNYFTLGYYMLKNPDANVDDLSIEDLTKLTREFLDNDFMLDFIAKGEKAVANSREKSLAKKQALLEKLEAAKAHFNADVIDKKATNRLIGELSALVSDAIDRLSIRKNSTEYTFTSSIKNACAKYFLGVKNNPIEQARFDKQQAKYNKLLEKGKSPDWKVIPAALTDLTVAKNNILKIIDNLYNSYKDELNRRDEFNAHNEVIALIDFLKEQASAVVYKVTPKIAKARAIKLMEEVGIPEPAIRYKQYPFEFSGGMRQRIVIAIALAANPDILICDEPTTALDVTIQSQILELINKIKVERNLSVIFITHDLGVVANMADRIAVMYAGKIVEYGTSEDVFYEPRHPYTWALLSSMPDLDTDDKLDAIPGTPPNMIYPPKGDAFAARNKYALEIDFEVQPPLFKVSDTHYAATWLLHPDAPQVDPPKQVTDRINRMRNLNKEEN